ncbi:hypothetical protein [Clostridium septicum]|uniref:Uncharacterized protein n=1 Tax=Clostridium septicum TaxID=1504 RepID=A0ABY5B4V7_CLOSE|nr:hypothetical protein [Clostridium septicum]UEC19659.1 hypothetical protein LK444_09505 [Clostridium septicum]USS02280.1 hypothetical protein NH397_07670 [Clostridium septicum]WLF70863.1 hypothetical protein Q6375_07775 [Clostridium septicum]
MTREKIEIIKSVVNAFNLMDNCNKEFIAGYMLGVQAEQQRVKKELKN